MKYSSIKITTILAIITILSCSDEKKVNDKLLKNMEEYEKIASILLKNKDSLMLNYDKTTTFKVKDIILNSNYRNFKNVVIPNNPNIRKDLYELDSIWQKSLNQPDSYISFETNNTIRLGVRFYNGGVMDSSYTHFIVYDPNNYYHQNSNKCADLHLIKILKFPWKYVICRTAFN